MRASPLIGSIIQPSSPHLRLRGNFHWVRMLDRVYKIIRPEKLWYKHKAIQILLQTEHYFFLIYFCYIDICYQSLKFIIIFIFGGWMKFFFLFLQINTEYFKIKWNLFFNVTDWLYRPLHKFSTVHYFNHN